MPGEQRPESLSLVALRLCGAAAHALLHNLTAQGRPDQTEPERLCRMRQLDLGVDSGCFVASIYALDVRTAKPLLNGRFFTIVFHYGFIPAKMTVFVPTGYATKLSRTVAHYYGTLSSTFHIPLSTYGVVM